MAESLKTICILNVHIYKVNYFYNKKECNITLDLYNDLEKTKYLQHSKSFEYKMRSAALKNDLAFVRYFINTGKADINCVRPRKNPFSKQHPKGVLALCADRQNFQVLKFLLENIPNLCHKDCTEMVLISAEKGHIEILEYVSKKLKICNSALTRAATNNQFEVVKFLIEVGAYTEACVKIALVISSRRRHEKIARYIEQVLSETTE
jgi:hypothetical protein